MSIRREPTDPTRRRALRQGAWLAAGAAWPPVQAAQAGAPPRAPAAGPDGPWRHAHAAYGEPKHPAGFAHFDYVRPDAPKGGTLYLRNPDRRSSFDKYNPFTTRGSAPAGLMLFMFEPLAVLGGDEPMTMYGLLAEGIQVAKDRAWIAFRLDPRARFFDGDPVTAADVRHTFEQVSGPQAAPAMQSAFAIVERLEVLDERTVRFHLKDRSIDSLFTLGGLRVFSRKWGRLPDGRHKRFDELVDEVPITSGPYLFAGADSGRRIEFRRNPEYWARDLGVRRGCYNFDRVVYRYYQDQSVSREAFKAGEFDLMKEYSARAWVRQHKGPKWDDGRIARDLFETATGQGLQSYQLNLRRPKFQDRRVREALGYTYDFDTLDRYRLFRRCNSQFNNSEFAAEGLPSPGELALLEPFRAELPPEVFGPPFRAPSTGRDPLRLRENLRRARALLEQAGWQVAEDGRLRDAAGEAFDIEYLVPGEGRRMPEWESSLAKLGIALRVREVDFALYRRRLEEYDFEMITIAGGDFTLPSVLELVTVFGSKSADEKGNNNFRGVKSAAVDRILEAMGAANDMQSLRDAARALDRVVMWSHWQVPDLYAADEKASYWNRFGMPARRPRHFTIDSAISDHPAWPVLTWWELKPAGK